MKSILETLFKADFIELTVYGLVVNFGIYFASLGLYSVLNNLPGSRKMGSQQPILRSDVWLSLVTVICNTIVFVFGVLLWRYGFIRLSENNSWLYILAEVIVLTLIMDLLMYVFHRSVHILRYFSRVHERHHEHESTNMLSLFVLHPVESIGFGLMMLAVVCLISFSEPGITIYLIINSLWGTIGHLNHSVLPRSWSNIAQKAFVCTSEFHFLHHQHPGCNFGFYSSIWDLIFKTIHPSLRRNEED